MRKEFRRQDSRDISASPINQTELYQALLQVAGKAVDEDRLVTRYTALEHDNIGVKFYWWKTILPINR